MKICQYFCNVIFLFTFVIFVPSVWSTDFYVSPSGLDSNPGTSPNAPWGNITNSVNRLNPGDRLIVMNGRYLINEWDNILTPPSGNAGAWVTIEGQAGFRPVLAGGNDLDRMFTLSGKSYIHLKNLEITHDNQATGEAMWFRNGIVCDDEGQCSNIILENLYIHHVDDMAVNMQDVNNIQILNSRFEYCAISAIGGPQSNGLGGWRNATIKGCSLSYSGHYYQGGDNSTHIYDRPDGMEIPHGSQGPLLVEDTIAAHNYGDGLDASVANTTIRRCLVANNSCTGVKLWRGDSRVENTLIYGRGDGTNLTGYWSAINIKTEQTGDSFSLINVTIDDFVGTNYLMHVQYDFPNTPINLTMRNCIFSARGESTGIFLRDVVTFVAENNLFYMPNWTEEIFQHGEDSTPYTSTTITSLGTGNLYGDPRFVKPAWGTEGDYRLMSGSPAINNGSSVEAPGVDINNYIRTGSIDIGAYEHGTQFIDPPGPSWVPGVVPPSPSDSRGLPWLLLLLRNKM